MKEVIYVRVGTALHYNCDVLLLILAARIEG